MLNKKRLFALLMVGALLPAGINAVDSDDEGSGDGGAKIAKTGDKKGGGKKGGAGTGEGSGSRKPKGGKKGGGAGGGGGGGTPPADPGMLDNVVDALGAPFGFIDKIPGVNFLKTKLHPYVVSGPKAALTILIAYFATQKESIQDTAVEITKGLLGGDSDDGACQRSRGRATFDEDGE